MDIHEEDEGALIEEFRSLDPEAYTTTYKIYNIVSGGITDPQLQALLVYRHLIHTGWLPPSEAEQLKITKEDAVAELSLLRSEVQRQEDEDRDRLF